MSLADTTPITANKMSAHKAVVTLKVTLRGSRPPIWRRLVMPGSATLADLHHAIQAAMGWYNSHLHQFDIDGQSYGERRMLDHVADENRMTLNKLANAGAKRFSYTYDFGDNWEHVVAIEKVSKTGADPSGPMCIAGKRACPPEDCGGLWGYYHLLDVLADPNHPEYDDQREWISEDFDPDAFDLARTNLNIKARIR